MQLIKGIKLEKNVSISSYDVKALLISVPIEPALKIIKGQLEQDKELHLRTSVTVDSIITLLEFCLKNTYFCSR